MNTGPKTELVERAAAGDRGAFRRWLHETHGLVYRLCLRIIGSSHEAEDLVQETYVRAWRRLSSLRDPSKSVEWVCRIARNLAYTRSVRRHRRATPRLEQSAGEGLEGGFRRALARDKSPEEAAVAAQEAGLLREAIESLSDKHRTVLLLREMDGLAHEEIAAALGCSVGTIHSRLHRAKTKLAQKLRRLRSFDSAGERP